MGLLTIAAKNKREAIEKSIKKEYNEVYSVCKIQSGIYSVLAHRNTDKKRVGENEIKKILSRKCSKLRGWE